MSQVSWTMSVSQMSNKPSMQHGTGGWVISLKSKMDTDVTIFKVKFSVSTERVKCKFAVSLQ